MSERTKKILFAVFFVFFSVGMGYMLFVMFFKSQQQPPAASQQPTQQPVTGRFPTADSGSPQGVDGTDGRGGSGADPGVIPGTTPVNSFPQAASRIRLLRDGVTQAVSPSIDKNGARFYNPEDGRFYTATSDGSVTQLSDKQFFNVQRVDWAHTTNKAILEFPDQQSIFYDFATERQVVLPKHWSEFAFSPNDTQVVSKSMGTDPENRFLITSKPDGTEAKAIEPLGDNADLAHVSWSPTSQIIGYAFTGEPQGAGQQEVLFVGQHHENFKSITAPGQDFLPNWSPNGKQILFSVWSDASNGQPNLWITSGDVAMLGQGRRNLNLRTWSDKCVWADETNIYCGVPQGLPENAGLQRQDFATLPDDIYHVDLKAGSSVKISTPEQTRPIRNPVLNTDRSKLIFSDAESGKLYSYDLK